MSDFTMREAVYGGKCPTNVLFKTDFLCVVDESISRLLTGAWVTLYMTDVSPPTFCFIKDGNVSHTLFGNGTYAPEMEPTPLKRNLRPVSEVPQEDTKGHGHTVKCVPYLRRQLVFGGVQGAAHGHHLSTQVQLHL